MGKKPTQFEQIGEGFDDVMDVLVGKEPDKKRTVDIKHLFDEFERIKEDSEGVEFWYARDIQVLLGYKDWRNLEAVISKARIACNSSGYDELDHFVDVNKKVSLGSGSERTIKDVALTRYACYLIAQNGDPNKIEIAFAQTYFATQTRKLELLQQQIEEIERVEARHKLQETEKQLSGIVYKRGFGDKDFGLMRSKGDKALFGGRDTRTMKAILGVPQNRPLADFTDTVIIKGKDFASAMTAFNAESNNLHGVDAITDEHVINNIAVRNALTSRGIFPEDLPAKEDIKKVERRLNSDTKQIGKNAEALNLPEEKEFSLHVIDIANDLWKIALLVMATKPGGIVTTKELHTEIPKYIIIPKEYQEFSETKQEPKINQIIRNLKSNKKNKTSMFSRGYATDIKGGFQITKEGLDFVREAFKDFV